MRKGRHAVLALMAAALCACGSEPRAKKSEAVSGFDSAQNLPAVIDELAAKQEESEADQEAAQPDAVNEERENGDTAEKKVKLMEWQGPVDIDLTGMSSTMIYSEVFNMMVKPDEYDGKAVRIFGMYTDYTVSEEKVLHACIVKDAAQCCAQGLEFIAAEGYVWPDDYPENGDEITVTGIFEVYEEGNYKVMNLRDAVIESHIPKQPSE